MNLLLRLVVLHLTLNIIWRIEVDPVALEQVRNLYAPHSDPVFTSVPPTFAAYAETLFASAGSPVITRHNVWAVYQELYHRFEYLNAAAEYLKGCSPTELNECENDLLSDYTLPSIHGRELAGGNDDWDGESLYYMGGVNNGSGLGRVHSLAVQRSSS